MYPDRARRTAYSGYSAGQKGFHHSILLALLLQPTGCAICGDEYEPRVSRYYQNLLCAGQNRETAFMWRATAQDVAVQKHLLSASREHFKRSRRLLIARRALLSGEDRAAVAMLHFSERLY